MNIRQYLSKVDDKIGKRKAIAKVEASLESILEPYDGAVKKATILKYVGYDLGYKSLTREFKEQIWELVESKHPHQVSAYSGAVVLRGKKVKGTNEGCFINKGLYKNFKNKKYHNIKDAIGEDGER